MKRLLLAALVAALMVPQAWAFNPVATTPRVLPARTFPTARKPLAQRVLVVFDTYERILSESNVKGKHAAYSKFVGPTTDAWREIGDAQVDYLGSDFFELPADSSIGDAAHKQGPAALWQTLGSYYPTVVCVGFSGDTTTGKAARKRYFSADSTTAKIVHVGGWNGGTAWNGWTFGIADTGGTTAYFDSRKAGVRAYRSSTADTLWGKFGHGVRSGLLAPGVASVVRLFEPVKHGSLGYPTTYFGWGPDSATSVLPALGDTVAKPGEIMPVAWRVYWTTSGRSVDYVKGAGTADYDESLGHVLTAIVSRTTKMEPALAAMEWDDLFDVNPTTGTRPSNAAVDSVITEFRTTWGVPLTFATNPRHAMEYLAGTDPTREGAWASGAGWTWLKRGFPLVHHAHDSTSSDIASGLMGRFGGYSTHNRAVDSAGTNVNTRYDYSHRYGNAAVNGDAYTIKYRLQWADSALRSVAPACWTPPYLSFSNNEMLPIDWRVSTGQSVASAVRAGFVSRWKAYQGDGECGIDSTLLALHNGLGLASGEEMFVRTGVANNGTGSASSFEAHGTLPSGWTNGPPSDDAPHNWLTYGDGDSVIAKTPFAYPGQRWSAYIDDKLVRVRNITPTPYDGTARANYLANVQRVIPALMGSRTGTLTMGGFSTWAESWSKDPGAVLSSGDQRNFGTMNSRMTYLHPMTNNWTNATGPSTSYSIQVARLGLLGGLRVLENVSAHKLIKWVYPWQVYD